MDEKPKFLLYNDNEATLDAVAKRRMVVEDALDLICHKAMNGSSRNSLDSNLSYLSDYADMIQEALRGSEALRSREEALRDREDALRGREEALRHREH